jgi:hypothetical protein
VEGAQVSLDVAVVKADGTPCVTGSVQLALN